MRLRRVENERKNERREQKTIYKKQKTNLKEYKKKY
jgi:hypothetical protein